MSAQEWLNGENNDLSEPRTVGWREREKDQVKAAFGVNLKPLSSEPADSSGRTGGLVSRGPSVQPAAGGENQTREARPSLLPETQLMFENGITALKAAASDLRDISRRLDAESAQAVLELGMAVAEELAAGAISAEPERIIKIVEEALKQVGSNSLIRIRVSSRMMEKLMALDEYKNGGLWEDFEVVVDSELGEAGCVIDANFQHVDTRIKSRLSQLRHALQVEMGQSV